MRTKPQEFALYVSLFAIVLMAQAAIGLQAQSSPAASSPHRAGVSGQSIPAVPIPQSEVDLHRAARDGDLPVLRSRLQQGADPNAKDPAGHTPLFEAVAAGHAESASLLLSAGAKPGVTSADGRTPLIEAAAQGRLDIAELLIQAGADLDVAQRGFGTALETAERNGHNDVAARLHQAGAKTSGRSIGDTVCVRPWKGDGYCGTVKSVNRTEFTIRISRLVGCNSGCPARAECSAGMAVGGTDGLHAGDEVITRSWCLTHTGVQP